MPIYEYRCTDCGHQEEQLRKLSEAPLTECPACRKPTFKKLLSAAGFQLKGSGWYATDFKNKAKTETKPETKTEAKTETKTETKKEAAPAVTTD